MATSKTASKLDAMLSELETHIEDLLLDKADAHDSAIDPSFSPIVRVRDVIECTGAVSGYFNVLSTQPSVDNRNGVGWQMRFFVLVPGMLYSFRNAGEDEEEMDRLPLSSTSKVFPSAENVGMFGPLAFEVLDSATNKVWILSAPNKLSKNTWMEAIVSAIPVSYPAFHAHPQQPVLQLPMPINKPGTTRANSLGHSVGGYVSHHTRNLSMRSNPSVDMYSNQYSYRHDSAGGVPPSPVSAYGGDFPSSWRMNSTEEAYYSDNLPSFDGSSYRSSAAVSSVGSLGSPTYGVLPSAAALSSQAGIPKGGVFGGGDEDDAKSSSGKTTASQEEAATKNVVIPKKVKSTKAHIAKSFVQF